MVHIQFHGPDRVIDSQVQFHRKVIEGVAGNPNQYRMLVPWVMQWVLDGDPDVVWSLDLAIVVRVVQQVLLFTAFGLYLSALRVKAEGVVIGMSVLAMGMMNGIRWADLSFSTYTDIAFFLLAGWAVISRRYIWTLPLMVLAGLNRETSILIPFCVLSALVWDGDRGGEIVGVALAGMAIWCVEFVALRWLFDPQVPNPGYNDLTFPFLWKHNLTHPLGWMVMILTLGLFPAWTVWKWKVLDVKLRWMFWVLVPAWVVAMTMGANFVEARVFLVPQTMVFIPAFLTTSLKGKIT